MLCGAQAILTKHGAQVVKLPWQPAQDFRKSHKMIVQYHLSIFPMLCRFTFPVYFLFALFSHHSENQ